ncbi:MAG: sugar phosphate isomerase/epimerase [Acidobacteriota bacterium]|nr:sugar phosphate isomerase/epimerase [Acidobacteriota bacterium]
MYTRRDFGKIALAALPASALRAQKKINSTLAGVRIGAQSYSFREKPLDGVIQAMTGIGLGECELFSPHIEPKGVSRDDLRKWRLTVPLDEIKAVRTKFDDAGINLCAFNLSFNDSFTDEEIDRGFDMAKALGVPMITASATVTSAKRIAPFAEKHNMTVAFHGHSDVKDPNQFAKPEAFAQALAMSKKFAINLDIGHFVAANYDPVEYIQAQHEHILILHLKDRKRDQGPNMPWGQGDTPIKQVLQLLKKEKYPMRALIEYEYRGASDSVTEVKKCFEYCKEALA